MKKRIAAALCLALALCLLASCGKGQLRVEVWRRTADPERALSESVIQPETRTVQLQAGSVNGAVLTFCALDGVDSVTIYSLGQRLAGPLDESGIFLGE